MARSGLQQDVINMYRQGVRNAMSKPREARPAFLLHMRYNFRNPALGPRDFSAIEHQLRRMSRTLEMLSEPSVTRLAVSDDMHHWWAGEVSAVQSQASSSPSASAEPGPSRPAVVSATPQSTRDASQGTSRVVGAAEGPGLQTDQAADVIAQGSRAGLGQDREPHHRAGHEPGCVRKEENEDRDQWHGTLPGHGGT
ncbi:hypothetical protein EHS25_000076 [Saitozyma podzolica]|uniref:Succinate dehydrogenase assembly factor 1, mitochondrial n=1 Tax=Saitozyma podzolica TaxID=1890683 RepID=A0A427YVG1_9TREE|nr:hypothetical protein EHS25_000076 [Saitozyma podzolica]